MQSISTIGLDIAKSVFQVDGVDAAGQVVLRQRRHGPRRKRRDCTTRCHLALAAGFQGSGPGSRPEAATDSRPI